MGRPALYDDLIMDHIRNARNYRAIADPDHAAVGENPLCGDELKMYLSLDGGGRIADIAFECSCCGITMASASLMTEHVMGCGLEAAADMAQAFKGIADGANHSTSSTDPVVQTVLEIARQYPARQRCAALPWETLGRLIEQLPRSGRRVRQGRA